MNEIRIRPLVWPHLIFMLIAIGLAYTPYWAFFLKEDADVPDTMAYLITGGMWAITAGILFFGLKIVIKRPDVILVNDKGFEYNPGGVSSGFVYWADVLEVKRVAVRATAGDAPGPVWETTLAVKMKDATAYRGHFNPFLRGLMHLNEKMYDADIFIRISSLGKQAEAVERLMMKYGGSPVPDAFEQ